MVSDKIGCSNGVRMTTRFQELREEMRCTSPIRCEIHGLTEMEVIKRKCPFCQIEKERNEALTRVEAAKKSFKALDAYFETHEDSPSWPKICPVCKNEDTEHEDCNMNAWTDYEKYRKAFEENGE